MIGSRRPHRRVEEKLHRIQAVTDAALSGLGVDDLLAQLLERTRDLLDVDTAAIMLVDTSTRELVATAAAGMDDDVRAGLRIPIGHGFAGRVASLAEPLAIQDTDTDVVVAQALLDKHLTAMAGVPMVANGRVLGVLHVGSIVPRTFTSDDLELLRLVADRAALAAQARMSQLDRATTLALQRSLLPTRLPIVDGLDIAARYLPGAQVGVGGDWYDLFQLPSGHVGLAIGDVAGNGLRAAVVMGRIRSALRSYALETLDPADVLTRLDRKIQFFEPDAMATAVYAVLSPDHRTIVISSAGHLAPMMIDTKGARSLAITIDLPLGAYPDAARHNVSADLPAGSAVMFYTDGLVERRDRPIYDGIARLRADLEAGTAEQLCNRAAGGLQVEGSGSDDVAILAVCRNE